MNRQGTNMSFIAMRFDSSMDSARDERIMQAIHDEGYEPKHLAIADHISSITDEIIRQIRAAAFIVSDFTYGAHSVGLGSIGEVGGSVYFEAGFAMALSKPVFWTVKDCCLGYLHFDVAQYPHLV